MRFENNQSAKWDGKEAEVPGRTVVRLGWRGKDGLEKAEVHWPGKGRGKAGKVKVWRCVVLEGEEEEGQATAEDPQPAAQDPQTATEDPQRVSADPQELGMWVSDFEKEGTPPPPLATSMVCPPPPATADPTQKIFTGIAHGYCKSRSL